MGLSLLHMVCECVALCVSFPIHPGASSWCWDLWPAGKGGRLILHSCDCGQILTGMAHTPTIREVQVSVKALHNYTTRDDSKWTYNQWMYKLIGKQCCDLYKPYLVVSVFKTLKVSDVTKNLCSIIINRVSWKLTSQSLPLEINETELIQPPCTRHTSSNSKGLGLIIWHKYYLAHKPL